MTRRTKNSQVAAEPKLESELQVDRSGSTRSCEQMMKQASRRELVPEAARTLPGDLNAAGVWALTLSAMDAVLCSVVLLSLGVSSSLQV